MRLRLQLRGHLRNMKTREIKVVGWREGVVPGKKFFYGKGWGEDSKEGSGREMGWVRFRKKVVTSQRQEQ